MVTLDGRPAGPVSRTVEVPGFVVRLGLHPAGSSLPRHDHPDPTICYVLQGGFTEYSPGRTADCGAATFKLTPAGEPHWNRFGRVDTRGLRIDVDPGRFADAPAIRRALDERRHTTGGRVDALVRRLMLEVSLSDSATPVAVEGLALELVAELARQEPGRDRATPRWLLTAEEVVRQRYRTRVTVGEIAGLVDVHPVRLSRAYRRRFGWTIGEHIRRLRLEHAARALAETDVPLSEIALKAGFYDQAHFTNVFRRWFGVTPGVFRGGG